MIQLRLMGTTELTREDGVTVQSVLAQPKRLALLVYLALHQDPGAFVRRDHLVAVFWRDKDEARARNSLRQALHFLRRSLGSEALLVRGDGEVALDRKRFQVDVWSLATTTDPTEILELWRGPFLEGFHLDGCPGFDEWLEAERARLTRLAWRKVGEGAEEGGGEDALKLARFAVELRPLDEASARRLMRLLAEQGHGAAALQEFDRLDGRLMEAIGRGADEETRALARSLRTARPEVREPPDGVTQDLADAGRGRPRVRPSQRPSPGPTRGRGEHRLQVPTTGVVILALVVVVWVLLTAPDAPREGRTGVDGGAHDPSWLLVEAASDSATRQIHQALLEVLRVDLNEGPGIAVLPRAHVTDGLQRMRRPLDEVLTRERALELARRDGLAGVVRTAVRQAGDGYLLTGEVLDRDGSPRSQLRVTAAGRPELIPAFERLSGDLRTQLGRIRTTPAAPLPRVTTRSIAALEHYALALADGPRVHLERAVELDPDFAMAWLELGDRHDLWPYDSVTAEPFLRRAWALRDEVSRGERHQIEFVWYSQFMGDLRAAGAASDAYIAARPRDESTWLEQQMRLAWFREEWTEAARLGLRRWAVDGKLDVRDWAAVAGFQFIQEDHEGLARTLADAPSQAERLLADFRIAAGLHEWDEALRLLQTLPQVNREWDVWSVVPEWETLANLGAGRVETAREGLDRAREVFRGEGELDSLAELLADVALAELWHVGDTTTALALLDEAETVLSRPGARMALDVAWALAEAGQTERARRILESWEVAVASVPQPRWPERWWVARAALDLAEGRPAEAAAFLERPLNEAVGNLVACRFCPELMMARALDQSGRVEEAIPWYERYVAGRNLIGWDRRLNVVLHVPARERLARLYEQSGRGADAAAQYREILRIWRDAGPTLRPRIEAARAALTRVGAHE